MIDFHTHILPCIDDGAKTVEESFSMLTSLKNQGVTKVILTSHFYHHNETLEQFLYKREEAYKKILPFSKNLDIKLVLASETYLTDSLLNLPKLNDLCLNGKNILLLELPFDTNFSNRTIHNIQKIISNFSVIPVLAHIDRYPQFFKDTEAIEEFIDMGCLMQINLNSLQQGFFMKHRIIKYFQNGLIHFVATDCHNMTSRPPDYKTGTDYIIKKLGLDFFEQFTKKSHELCEI